MTGNHETSSDLMIVRGTVITMDPERRVLDDAAVAIDGDVIAAVGSYAEVARRFPGATVTGTADDLVTPGYVNAHQHLTGDRLIQSNIPDDLPPGASIFTWAVPVHAEHRPEDDRLSATLSLAEAVSNGITTTVEAGTVAHPDQVAAAAVDVGARITLGRWGWDIDEGPFAAPAPETLARLAALVRTDFGPLVTPWVTLVGHDLMSDELVSGAADLARAEGTNLTFHLSPTTSDPDQYLARTGRRPVVHMNELGVLGPHLLLGHAVHLDDEEVELVLSTSTAVASCPWAYLRLGQGISRSLRHLDLWSAGGRLALGCDSENAGDAVDGLRAATLFAGLAKDVPVDPTRFGALDALALLTIGGAEAIGMGDRIGSIEIGKQADIVVHDRSGAAWQPISADPVLQLVWGSDGRSVRDVWIAGRQIVESAGVVTVDVAGLGSAGRRAGRGLMDRARVGS